MKHLDAKLIKIVFHQKTKICDPKAEALLGKVLMSTQIYKSPQNYIYCMDTYYVESFTFAIS
jgi:hypothetical protein